MTSKEHAIDIIEQAIDRYIRICPNERLLANIAYNALQEAGLIGYSDAMMDRQWIAGAQFGWNCGITENRERLNRAIEFRIDERLAVDIALDEEAKRHDK